MCRRLAVASLAFLRVDEAGSLITRVLPCSLRKGVPVILNVLKGNLVLSHVLWTPRCILFQR